MEHVSTDKNKNMIQNICNKNEAVFIIIVKRKVYLSICIMFIRLNWKTIFEPNRYDWRITDKQISYHPEEALPVLLQVKLLPNKLHRLYLNYLISKYPKRQLHIYSNALFADSRFSQNFSDLFRPTFRLQEALSVQVTHISEPYITMVFRFQQLLGD